MTKKDVFNPVLDMIQNESIKEFANYLIKHRCPDYFYEIGASSTGKYHPSYSLGELGLARHTCSLCQILTWILDLEYVTEKIDSRKRDLLIVSGLVHDWYKLGLPEDKQKYTVFNHPTLAADMIRECKELPFRGVSDAELEFIAEACESHMGQWNEDTKSDCVLPKPQNNYQFVLHLADYLSSRKSLEMLFDDWKKPELPDINDYKLNFGKHNGMTLPEIKEANPGYIEWLKENYGKEPIRSLLKQI